MNPTFYQKVVLLFSSLSFLSHTIQAQNVGIGTTSPQTQLHITRADSALLLLENTHTFADSLKAALFFKAGGYFTGAIKTQVQSSLLKTSRLGFFTFASPTGGGLLERMTILDNGSVGIGTVAPTTTLDINGNVRIRGGNPAASLVLVSDASGNAAWKANTGGILVDTVTVQSAKWIWNSQYSFETSGGSYTEYFTRYVDIPITQLTNAFLAGGGSVQVYFTPNPLTNTLMWLPLPYIFTDGSGNFNYNIAYETMPGVLRLHYFFVQLVSSATIPVLSSFSIPVYQFKVVLMPGTIIG